MADVAVRAEDVTFHVDGANLVSEVNLTASRGRVLAIIGPNGAGKSTLLALLAGDVLPHEGRVLLDGAETAAAFPGDLALVRAVLTQRTPVDIPYTAAQVVEMGRFPHRRDETNTSERDAAAVADAMRRTDTTQFAARTYATLSGGERTRVSLARVLAQETPIVLLDEPTTALDVAHQERIMREAVRVSRDDRAVIVVLHDLNAAAVYADEIVLMSRSRIVAEGPPRSVLRSGLLSEVYGQPMVVVDHPFRDVPLVLVDALEN